MTFRQLTTALKFSNPDEHLKEVMNSHHDKSRLTSYCIAQPTLAYVHTLGNIGQPRTWLSEVLDQTSAQHSASVLHHHY